MKYLSILFFSILSLVLLSTNAFADDIEQCKSINEISCNDCVTIETKLSTGDDSSEYIIGGYQTYTLLVKNIGSNELNTTFKVKVLDPNKEQIGKERIYSINLKPNQIKKLFPNQTEKSDIFDVYTFDVIGDHRIVVESTKPVNFYRFFRQMFFNVTHGSIICPFTFHPNYTFHYDVISISDKQWRDTLRSWQTETQDSGTTTITLIHATVFLTILTVLFVIYDLLKRETFNSLITKIVFFFLLLILTSILTVLAWQYTIIQNIVNILNLPNFLLGDMISNTLYKDVLFFVWQFILASIIVELGDIAKRRKK